jgi:hypothetical protein
MPTMGLFRCMAPVDPKKGASPKLKMPPSAATNQYPAPSGEDSMPTMGLLSFCPGLSTAGTEP